MKIDKILSELRSMANPESVKGMASYGINPNNTLGISMPRLRAIAKRLGKDHQVAKRLWASGIHEARILAALIDEPEKVTEEQLETWVMDIDSWDICDLCCANLFDRTRFARSKVVEWSNRKEEFVKRSGFTLMAVLAVHDKEANDELFLSFLPLIERESIDERNYVRKAVNWALRQIGKRNNKLNKFAIESAHRMKTSNSKSTRWIGSDALRELTSEAVLRRLEKQDGQTPKKASKRK